MVTSFARGLITNTAYYGRKPEASAELVHDARCDEKGWLIPRRGRIRVNGAPNITHVFAYRGFLFVVSDGQLLWGRVPNTIPTSEITVAFTAFDPVRSVGVDDVAFFSQEDYVFVSGSELLAIRVREDADAPVVDAFYIDAIPTDAIEVLHHDAPSGITYGLFRSLHFVFQPVYVDVESTPQEELPVTQGATGEFLPMLAPKQVIGPKSEPVKVPSVLMEQRAISGVGTGNDTSLISLSVSPKAATQEIEIAYKLTKDINLTIQIQNDQGLPLRTLLLDETYLFGGANDQKPDQSDPALKSILWDGRDAAGVLLPPVARGGYKVAFIERRYVANGEDTYHAADIPLTWEAVAMQVNFSAAAQVAGANYIDVYSTLGDETTAYHWIARIPIDGELIYQFPLVFDASRPSVLDFESPNYRFIAANEFRTYVAEANSNKVYLSHYEPGTAERLYQNFTDIIPLEIDEGFITGLHFLRDGHLVVYCSNQIQMIATDPDPALHAVMDYIKPQDDNGENIGCIAPQTIVNILGVHYFLATNQHVYTFDGQRVLPISYPVQGVFDGQTAPVTENGQLQFENAVAYATKEDYILAISTPAVSNRLPNLIMVYDRTHGIWWQDTFAFRAVTKTVSGLVFAADNGVLFLPYQGDRDFGERVRYTWKNNPYLQRSHSHWDSVHVYSLGAAEIDIIAITEQGRREGHLSIPDAGDWWSQRLGLPGLRGRFYQVQITTDAPMPIDRIMVNERPGG